MRGIFFSLITFVLSVAVAQEEPKHVWVELNLPFTQNDGFGDAQGDSKTSSKGRGGFTVGWEPLHDMQSDNNKVKKFFQNAGFTFNITMNNNQPKDLYDVNLGQELTLLSPFEVSTTCGGQLTGGPNCVSCGFDDFGIGRVCTAETIYGRFAPIKYETGSAALGMYIPYNIAKLVIQAGVEGRLHLTREGTVSNELKKSAETTLGATLRVAYPVRPSILVSGGVGQSVLGSKSGNKRFSSRTYRIGVSKVW